MDIPGFSPIKAGDVGVWARVIDKKTGLPRTDQAFDWDCYIVVRTPPITNAAGKMQFDAISIVDGGEETVFTWLYDDNTGKWISSESDCPGHGIHFFDPTILTDKNMKSSNSELKAYFSLEKGKEKEKERVEPKVGDLITLYIKSVWPDGTISYFRQPTTYTVTKSPYKFVIKAKEAITSKEGQIGLVRMDAKASSTGQEDMFIQTGEEDDVGMWFVCDSSYFVVVHHKEK
jgi:hypothetical protein